MKDVGLHWPISWSRNKALIFLEGPMVAEERAKVEFGEFQHTSASLDEVLARFKVGSFSLTSDEFTPFPWASNSSFLLADIVSRFFGCPSSDFKVGCRVTDDVLG